MFNPHQHQQQQQQQFHQHLRQLQQLFQQQTPPPPPPPPPPQPPPTHHITHHHQTARPIAVPAPAPPPARMVNLCSATQSIMAPNPMLQGALLMQQMQASSMRGFAMGGQQFPQFFTPGSRTSLLGPVPMGVAIKTPHMGFPRHFTPHQRYYSNDFQSHQPDRKRENEQKSEVSRSRADEAAGVADPGCQSSSEPLDESTAKKHKTDGSEELVETESTQISESKSPDPAECALQEAGSVDGPVATEANEQSRVAKQVESTDEHENSDVTDDITDSDTVTEMKETTATPLTARVQEEVKDGGGETASKFICYICNITCHNQQNFQSHMNGLTHQQKMMEIQHMSNACLVTLLPRVQESLQGARKEGEKRPGLQRWCSTCQTHFTSNVMDHRRTKEHKRCCRSSSTSCTVCKQEFRRPREFVEHMQSTEHKQRVKQLWKESGKDGVEELNSESFLDDEDSDVTDDEREDEENGKEGLSAQMEVTLEDLTEDEEFDADTVYGSSFVVPVAGFLCRLCNHFYHFESSARHAHCKTLKHFHNLKSYKALKTREDAGSTSAGSTDHHSPDKTSTREPRFTSPESLNPKPALQTPQSSSRSSPPVLSICRLSTNDPETVRSPNQQPEQDEDLAGVARSTPPSQSGLDAEDESITGEPEEEVVGCSISEVRAVRGRGRTPAKRRGRGGRRR
ncbi:cip1-interacting zinc finger protein-like isoform X2 [Myxocyprinus asiaticus]|uniref:cip1-interacting zinc finger protein-like isoform X2 n=1 Tax=Myxocyprinus asiaticus TaxID=70543 RepID=UPI002223DB71|nr:cip1-interacting zinc finger protein-like isoform X2 [Myxocyprinus asiaticus]